MDRQHDAQRSSADVRTGVAVRVGSDGTRRVEAGELFAGDREILILHAEQTYRLRVTASGKLILTK